MLMELSIRNFAIIEDLHIEFQKGFNVLTGETGAGKSIIIDAVNLILGGRANKDIIKSDAEKAIIDASFEITETNQVRNKMRDYGIDLDTTLVLSREIYQSGKNNIRINGRIATSNMLKDISSYLIDIHGQHEHQSLSDKQKHMDLLDRYGSEEIKVYLEQVKNKYEEIKKIKEELSEFQLNEEEKNRLIDIYKYQMEEIELAELVEGEEENLTQVYKKMTHQEELKESLFNMSCLLADEEAGALSQLQKAIRELGKVEKYDEKIAPYKEALQNYRYCIKDIERELIGIEKSIFLDEEDLFRIEKRLEQINDLKRKYGKDIFSIIEYFNVTQEKHDKLVEYDRLKNEKTSILKEKEDEIRDLANELTKIRKKYAEVLQSKMQENLSKLNFAKSDFFVEFKEKEKYTENGIDDVEFYIATNVGEVAKPLIKVASGGEMSRIMLAFKTIIADIDETPTLIFDEIDTGISGRTAQIVSENIMEISKKHQVICISHLPQIAVMGDTHHNIIKETESNMTRVIAKTLTFEERVEEISRLVGGADLNENTRQYARELLLSTQSIKMNTN